MRMAKAIFPGSFDPPTYGHINIIERAQMIFDEIHIVIAVNKNKNALFSPEERLEMLTQIVQPWKSITVALHDCLIIEYAKKTGINNIIRGIRNINDFLYEFDTSVINRAIYPKVETIFIPTEQRFVVHKSSSIKEVAAFGGDTSAMAPPLVVEALKNKFKNEQFK
jgi:pantetheine-phosphate adenylyltransferase